MELYNDNGWRITRDEYTLSNGAKALYTRAHRRNSVNILAIPSPNRVLLLKEFRPSEDDYVWALPSGGIEKDEEPQAAAQRELREETGFRSDDLQLFFVGRYGIEYVKRNYTFIANDIHKDPLPLSDAEQIEVHEMSIDEAIQKVSAGPFVSVMSGYALHRYKYEHQS